MTIETTRTEGRKPIGVSIRPWPQLPHLTGNQRMIYETLYGLGRAAKAYELLDILRPKGVKAAPTIYRALHELEGKGLVQHIVSSRSFVALSAPKNRLDSDVTLVCEECGETTWVESGPLVSAIAENARASGFKIRTCRVEFETACSRCDPKPIQ